jgi:hypothetical protein
MMQRIEIGFESNLIAIAFDLILRLVPNSTPDAQTSFRHLAVRCGQNKPVHENENCTQKNGPRSNISSPSTLFLCAQHQSQQKLM